MNYVFDIDGTICENTYGNYENAKPFLDRIRVVNDLYDQGNKIVLCTARGMGSSNNNREAAIARYYNFTKTQLESWGVKFHELHLGKPSGDIYVDDKGVSDEFFFNKAR